MKLFACCSSHKLENRINFNRIRRFIAVFYSGWVTKKPETSCCGYRVCVCLCVDICIDANPQTVHICTMCDRSIYILPFKMVAERFNVKQIGERIVLSIVKTIVNRISISCMLQEIGNNE